MLTNLIYTHHFFTTSILTRILVYSCCCG